MSVHFAQYWMYGVTTSYPKTGEAYDAVEVYSQSNHRAVGHHQGLAVLLDGLGGNYMLAGRILEKSELDYPMGSGPLVPPQISDEMKLEVARALQEQLGLEQPAALMLVTHYS